MSWFTSDSTPALAWKEVGTLLNSHRIPLIVATAQRQFYPGGGYFSLDDQRCCVPCENAHLLP